MAGKTHIALRAVSATALALALAACGQQGRQATIDNQALGQELAVLPPLPEVQPLTEGPAAPVRYAPPMSRLPTVQRLGYADAPYDDRYAWIDRADWISDTIGDAPPDYYFDYDDIEPWVWQTSAGYLIYAEPIDAGYRYYYYEPGADVPYFVRDPWYYYGYRNGRIATVYNRDGQYIAAADAARQAEAASRYYARARALRRAAAHGPQYGVPAAQWVERRPVIAAARTDWSEARQRVPDWQAYRQRNADAGRRLQPERVLRERAAQRFASWEREGRPGRPPQLYVPDRTDRAETRDDNRRIDQQQVRQQRRIDRAQAIAQRDAARPQQDLSRQQARQMAEQQRQAQQAQMQAQRDLARQRAAVGQQRAVQERQQHQQQAALRERARREHVLEPQRARQQAAALDQGRQRAQQQQAQRQRQVAERQRSQQQSVQRAAERQAQQRTIEQRGQQMRQQREAQRQQAEQRMTQQRAAQQQRVQQRAIEQRAQQASQQRQQAEQRAAQQQQRAAQQQQQAQQRQAQHQQVQQQARQQQQAQQRAMPHQQAQAQSPGRGPRKDRDH